MTRKTVGYVHLEWTCPRCDSKNPGPQKFCNGCGAPQPEDVEFQQPAQEVLIEDQAEIARAKVGPDVHCPYCMARNSGDAKFCGACGGDLAGAKARESGRVVGAHRAGPAEEIICPACSTPNPPTAHRCVNCGGSLAVEKPQPPGPIAEEKMTPKKKIGFSGIGIAALVLCILVVVVVIALGLRTKDIIGEVQEVQWTRAIPILALGPVENEGWFDEIPTDAELGDCRSEYHHTQDEPTANSIEVCGTPYTVDTGSGLGEVVEDCVYEVHEDWCTYTQIDWITVDTVTSSGYDLNTFWPDVTLSEGQVEGDGEEEYQVVFQTDERTHSFETADSNQFSQFEIGSRWILTVNTFNTVVSIEPAD